MTGVQTCALPIYVASIQLESFDVSWLEKAETFETSYELKSSEELEEEFLNEQE